MGEIRNRDVLGRTALASILSATSAVSRATLAKHSDVTMVRIYFLLKRKTPRRCSPSCTTTRRSVASRYSGHQRFRTFRQGATPRRCSTCRSTCRSSSSFFDEPAEVDRILSHLKDIPPAGHVVSAGKD